MTAEQNRTAASAKTPQESAAVPRRRRPQRSQAQGAARAGGEKAVVLEAAAVAGGGQLRTRQRPQLQRKVAPGRQQTARRPAPAAAPRPAPAPSPQGPKASGRKEIKSAKKEAIATRPPQRREATAGSRAVAAGHRTEVKRKTDGLFMRITPNRSDFITDIRSSILAQSPTGGRVILWLVFFFFLCFLVWAGFSQVDEVTRAAGRVIPSGKIRKVQHFEGGIIKKILIHEGDLVKKGEVLLEIDKTRFASSYRESRSNVLALQARLARLESEVNGRKFTIPEEVAKEKPAIGSREEQLYRSRMSAFENSQQMLKEQLSQRRQGLSETRAKLTELRRSYKLLQKEIRMTEPLVGQGAVSEVEVLRLKRQASEMNGKIVGTELAIPKLQSQVSEAKKAIEDGRLEFINQVRQELNRTYAELESLSSASVALEDRLNRTSVVSPVTGRVNQLLVNTVGGTIQPGMDLVEIVPLEDTLLIEARVRPQDIGFISPDQKAMVKVLSYDFTTYGGLQASLEHISSDTITDEHDNSYYKVILRTDKNYLGDENDPHLIMPGMPVNVDIISGKKSILSYLLKPLLRAKEEALRER